MVNFDNSATTFPKPDEVRKMADYAILKCGGNAGRGGHLLSMITSEYVFSARKSIADFFDAQPENVIFTLNCTHALNLAIKGIMKDGGHIITSSLEHNSVIRPLESMRKDGVISYSIAKVYYDEEKTINSFLEQIRPDTKAIACTLASNVTGQILPFRRIAEICRKHNLCFIADGAQICGVRPVSLKDGINILCTAGHKGLYGISGTGLLITDGKFHINHIIEGGTGSSSLEIQQPEFLPDSLESGTLNTAGILSMKAGVEFIKSKRIERVYEHENTLCEYFIKSMEKIPEAVIYRSSEALYVPIVSFNINGIPAEETASYLSSKGFCLRAGLHCAGLAHRNLGTLSGTVRFSPSVFNNKNEVSELVYFIKKLIFIKKNDSNPLK